jgi:hypothetical protein
MRGRDHRRPRNPYVRNVHCPVWPWPGCGEPSSFSCRSVDGCPLQLRGASRAACATIAVPRHNHCHFAGATVYGRAPRACGAPMFAAHLRTPCPGLAWPSLLLCAPLPHGVGRWCVGRSSFDAGGRYGTFPTTPVPGAGVWHQPRPSELHHQPRPCGDSGYVGAVAGLRAWVRLLAHPRRLQAQPRCCSHPVRCVTCGSRPGLRGTSACAPSRPRPV